MRKRKTKKCARCKKVLPISRFGQSFDKRVGRSYPTSRCFKCQYKSWVGPWQKRNRLRHNEYMKYEMRRRRNSKLPHSKSG